MILTALPLTAALVAAATDLATGKVRNRLTYSVACLGLGLHSLPVPGAQGAAFAGVGLGVGFALLLVPYLLGGTGGGDVKLLGAVGAFVGAEAIVIVLFLTCLAGVVYVAGQYAWFVTGASHAEWKDAVRRRELRLPFAVCIAFGAWGWLFAVHTGALAFGV